MHRNRTFAVFIATRALPWEIPLWWYITFTYHLIENNRQIQSIDTLTMWTDKKDKNSD